MIERMNKLREVSGNVQYNDTLTTFLYCLLRDHFPAGELEQMILDSKTKIVGEVTEFTNGWLAQYAHNLAEELKK